MDILRNDIHMQYIVRVCLCIYVKIKCKSKLTYH